MSALSEIEGYCPNCKADKWSWIKAQHETHGDEHGMWWHTTYRVLECKTCTTAFVQREEVCSEDVDHWYDDYGKPRSEYNKQFEYFPPKPKWPRPEWMGLSLISCLRHNMTPRSVYATQTKNPASRAADHCSRVA